MKDFLLAPLLASFAALISTSPVVAETRVPILIMQAEVNIDGDARPTLGRSLTDTLTSGLLKTQYFKIIDYMSSEDIAAELANDRSIDRAPEQDAARFGKMLGADYLFIPRMIVEQNYVCMSVKKIRVSDGEVLSIYDNAQDGNRSAMFSMADGILNTMYQDIHRERALKLADERRQKKKVELDNPADIKIEEPRMNGAVEVVDSRIVKPEESHAPEIKTLSLPVPEISPEKLAKEARKDEGNFSTEVAGTVTAVNRDWRFCIINVAKGGKIELNEELRVLLDDPLLNVAKLKVSKIEGRQVVADILTDIDPGMLKPGLRAFRWASTQ
jgi:TolB-like protein